jgi:hypothetical protein
MPKYAHSSRHLTPKRRKRITANLNCAVSNFFKKMQCGHEPCSALNLSARILEQTSVFRKGTPARIEVNH